MSFLHEAIAALPVVGPKDAAIIRALLTRRFAYCLTAVESATDFIAVDPDTGTIPLYLIQNNILFQFDASDSTTTNDGVTCLATSDGKRYKSASITYPSSVKTKGTTAQPASPSVGDRYLIPTAATGAQWGGKDAQIGIYTAAGWFFATVPIGRFLYVEDETAFYHRNTSGVWTAGVGSIALGSNTVSLSALIGGGLKSIVKIENQTTNAPPASPTVPTSYIIGSSPTGAWAGKPGQVARCEAAGTWTYYVPETGDRVYDKSLNNDVKWSGTAWLSATGSIVGYLSTFTQGTGTTTANNGTDYYAYADATAPVAHNDNRSDDVTLSYTAKKTGAKLRFTYQAKMPAGRIFTIGLMIDAVTTAIAWDQVDTSALTVSASQPLTFVVTAPDAASHVYKICLFDYSAGPIVPAPSHRLFEVQEIG